MIAIVRLMIAIVKLTIAIVEVPRHSYARNGILLSDRNLKP